MSRRNFGRSMLAGWWLNCGITSHSSRPSKSCAFCRRLNSNVRRFCPFCYSSFSHLFSAVCWFCQSGSAWVAFGGLFPGFTCPAQPLSRLLRSTGNFSQKRNLQSLGSSRLLGSFRLSAPVAAACHSLAARLSRQTLLTLRSRPLPSVAGRCAIKRRAAPLTYNVGRRLYAQRQMDIADHVLVASIFHK